MSIDSRRKGKGNGLLPLHDRREEWEIETVTGTTRESATSKLPFLDLQYGRHNCRCGAGGCPLPRELLYTMQGKEARSERWEAESIAVAIGALICGGGFAYHAASNEFTGKATYQPGILGSSVTVTREDSPSQFREITNFRWGVSGFCLAVSVVSFIFYRKHDDGSEDCV